MPRTTAHFDASISPRHRDARRRTGPGGRGRTDGPRRVLDVQRRALARGDPVDATILDRLNGCATRVEAAPDGSSRCSTRWHRRRTTRLRPSWRKKPEPPWRTQWEYEADRATAPSASGARTPAAETTSGRTPRHRYRGSFAEPVALINEAVASGELERAARLAAALRKRIARARGSEHRTPSKRSRQAYIAHLAATIPSARTSPWNSPRPDADSTTRARGRTSPGPRPPGPARQRRRPSSRASGCSPCGSGCRAGRDDSGGHRAVPSRRKAPGRTGSCMRRQSTVNATWNRSRKTPASEGSRVGGPHSSRPTGVGRPREYAVKWSVMGSAGARDARERALRALYEEQADPLYAYVVRLLGGDRHRAEDIVQETLLRCWSRQDLSVGGLRYSGPGCSGWPAIW